MAVSKDNIIANLRAIIISSKGGLKLTDVEVDYHETFGENIPFKALGYDNLEEFFKSNPENFYLVGNRIQAVKNNYSVHIASLVSSQKNTKKRRRTNLTTEQARSLRKPIRIPNELQNSSHIHKSSNHSPSFSRQNSLKENLLISGQGQTKKKEEKNIEKPDQIKSLMDLKGLTRTFANDQISSAKETVSATKSPNNSQNVKNNMRNEKPKRVVSFDGIEDFKLSQKAQSRLLKLKSSINCKIENINDAIRDNAGDNYNVNPGGYGSHFGRSLSKDQLELSLLSVNRYAQVGTVGNNVKPIADIPVMEGEGEEGSKYEQRLKQFCIDKNLIMPNYSIIVREPNNQPRLYGCKLTVGDYFQVSTYPIETDSEASARELASKKAYNQLTTDNSLLQLVHESKFVVELRQICIEKELPQPVFKRIECYPKNEPSYFIYKVQIGENILLSSYPVEAQDEMTARDLAALKAIDYLSSTNKSTAGTPRDDDVTLTRIFEIIKSKDYGVWSNKLPILYEEAHNEQLQSNWFELLQKCPKFEIETIPKVGHIIQVKEDSNSVIEISPPPLLATLKVPESNQWEVYITNVVNSCEIWCRLIGKEYSEVYDTMMTKLELQPPTANVKTPQIGEVYLVNLEESWNRVKVTELYTEKEEASVFFIDIGMEETVKVVQLFYLDNSFFSVPPQAILLSLNELDCLAECEELQAALLHTLLGNTFIAEIVAILDSGGNVSSANLWDTSTEEDININLKVLDDVIKTMKSPSLPRIGLVKEMFVSYVDDNGDVYIQTSKQNAHYVDWIISTKMKNSRTLVPGNKKKIVSQKLYVTRCSKTGLFYRAKLSKILDVNTLIVKFIDYGREQQAAVDDLFDLEETSLDLATIPCQAVKVRLANLKIVNDKIAAKIRELASEQNVLVKKTQEANEEPPSVELFRRSQSDGTLSSINNEIINNSKLETGDNTVRKKSFVVGLENTLFRNLPMPNIPPVGSYFNVFVTLAAHPGLFNVQPLNSRNELKELMFRLQEKCEGTPTKVLTPEEFKIGELYAVKHSNDFWYRAYAHAVISSSAYTVYLCDFGDFIMVPAEKLMPLSSEFKTFPYQAIRAYLAGVAPVNKDWTVVDCVNFRELVTEKRFVSEVVEINRDVKNPNYISLGLKLVDKSTDEDIYIHQLLIDRKMALLKV